MKHLLVCTCIKQNPCIILYKLLFWEGFCDTFSIFKIFDSFLMGFKENKVIKLSFRNKMYFMFKMKMAKHQVSTQYCMSGL